MSLKLPKRGGVALSLSLYKFGNESRRHSSGRFYMFDKLSLNIENIITYSPFLTNVDMTHVIDEMSHFRHVCRFVQILAVFRVKVFTLSSQSERLRTDAIVLFVTTIL